MNELLGSMLGKLAVVMALVLSAVAYAGDIQIDEVWTFSTVPGKDTANVYLYVTSKQAATLVGASSPKSKAVELRTMLHKGGMMKTIKVSSIDFPANKRVDMTSVHGYHLTLIDLESPLKAGKVVPLILQFEQADKHLVTIDVKVEIRQAKAGM